MEPLRVDLRSLMTSLEMMNDVQYETDVSIMNRFHRRKELQGLVIP